ncbi:uncharacterized protein [Argopecten irradians]|uniref:uncharacterized protein n=1 Tax=Argopecten irradians TaxID=31199 RepID=UPI00371001A6
MSYFLNGLKKKSQYSRRVNTIQFLFILYILLSNDVNLNPGPPDNNTGCGLCSMEVHSSETVTCIGCPTIVHSTCVNTTDQTTPVGLEWLCDVCVDHMSTFYDFYQSSDKEVQNLPPGLRFAHLNVRGLLSKLDYIRILLRNQTFDVLTISESHLDDSIEDGELSVSGYSMYRKDRNRRGGGVVTYVLNTLSSAAEYCETDLELLSITIRHNNSSPITCVTVYRPPNELANWYDRFDSVMEKLSTEKNNLVVLGDFNVDELKSFKLKDLMLLYNLRQQITVPTRETRDSSTLIDHIYTSDFIGHIVSGVIPLGCSDHHLVYAIRKLRGRSLNSHKTVQYRKFKDVNLKDLTADMQKVPWSSIEVQAKQNYLDESVMQCSKNSKELWKKIKEFLPSKKSTLTVNLKVDGSTISEKVEVANAFNDFFCNIGSVIGKTFDDSLPTVDNFVTDSPYFIPNITPDFVLGEIKKMADGKATGVDGISVKLLKIAGDSIVSPLTFLFNMSISNGTFPSEWKKAKVTPIFKAGESNLVNNYRPVSKDDRVLLDDEMDDKVLLDEERDDKVLVDVERDDKVLLCNKKDDRVLLDDKKDYVVCQMRELTEYCWMMREMRGYC